VVSAGGTSQVFLASRNAKKLGEMRRILAEHMPDVEVVGLDDVAAYDEPVEDQPTFAGNALLKARAGLLATGLPTVADDSGLCVDALNGMPGVLSARWSGSSSDERRGAHFTCAVAFCAPGVAELVVEGRMEGRVVREPRGGGGFGYDAVFEAAEQPGRTTAELDPADKDAISHRGRALREIAPQIATHLQG
jgi:XTP/dITP diphosphohydrolase